MCPAAGVRDGLATGTLRGLARRVQPERPHEALGYERPASCYERSPRSMPAVLPEPAYPGHYEVRYLSKDGNVRFKKRQFFVSQTLAHEHIGFEEVAAANRRGVGPVLLRPLASRLEERTWKLTA